MGWGSAPRAGRIILKKDPVRIEQEAGWAPGPVWMGGENPAPTGIRSPDSPARSEEIILRLIVMKDIYIYNFPTKSF